MGKIEDLTQKGIGKLADVAGKHVSYENIKKASDKIEEKVGKHLDGITEASKKVNYVELRFKEGQVEIFQKLGGKITLDKKGTIQIDLDSAHGTKTIHIDKKGIHIVSKAGGGSVFEITTEDVHVKVDKESVSVKAKQKISLESTDADISLKAPKGKILLEAKNLETKSTEMTKMKAEKDFELATSKNLKITSTEKTDIVATKDMKIKTKAEMAFEVSKTMKGQIQKLDLTTSTTKIAANSNLGLKAGGQLTEKGSVIRLN